MLKPDAKLIAFKLSIFFKQRHYRPKALGRYFLNANDTHQKAAAQNLNISLQYEFSRSKFTA